MAKFPFMKQCYRAFAQPVRYHSIGGNDDESQSKMKSASASMLMLAPIYTNALRHPLTGYPGVDKDQLHFSKNYKLKHSSKIKHTDHMKIRKCKESWKFKYMLSKKLPVGPTDSSTTTFNDHPIISGSRSRSQSHRDSLSDFDTDHDYDSLNKHFKHHHHRTRVRRNNKLLPFKSPVEKWDSGRGRAGTKRQNLYSRQKFEQLDLDTLDKVYAHRLKQYKAKTEDEQDPNNNIIEIHRHPHHESTQALSKSQVPSQSLDQENVLSTENEDTPALQVHFIRKRKLTDDLSNNSDCEAHLTTSLEYLKRPRFPSPMISQHQIQNQSQGESEGQSQIEIFKPPFTSASSKTPTSPSPVQKTPTSSLAAKNLVGFQLPDPDTDPVPTSQLQRPCSQLFSVPPFPIVSVEEKEPTPPPLTSSSPSPPPSSPPPPIRSHFQSQPTPPTSLVFGVDCEVATGGGAKKSALSLKSLNSCHPISGINAHNPCVITHSKMFQEENNYNPTILDVPSPSVLVSKSLLKTETKPHLPLRPHRRMSRNYNYCRSMHLPPSVKKPQAPPPLFKRRLRRGGDAAKMLAKSRPYPWPLSLLPPETLKSLGYPPGYRPYSNISNIFGNSYSAQPQAFLTGINPFSSTATANLAVNPLNSYPYSQTPTIVPLPMTRSQSQEKMIAHWPWTAPAPGLSSPYPYPYPMNQNQDQNAWFQYWNLQNQPHPWAPAVPTTGYQTWKDKMGSFSETSVTERGNNIAWAYGPESYNIPNENLAGGFQQQLSYQYPYSPYQFGGPQISNNCQNVGYGANACPYFQEQGACSCQDPCNCQYVPVQMQQCPYANANMNAGNRTVIKRKFPRESANACRCRIRDCVNRLCAPKSRTEIDYCCRRCRFQKEQESQYVAGLPKRPGCPVIPNCCCCCCCNQNS